MPAAVEVDTGAFAKAPWHDIGYVFDEQPTSSEELANMAGVNWEVRAKDVDFGTDSDGLQIRSDAGYKSIYRDDTGAVLNVPTARYTMFPNKDFVDTLQWIRDRSLGSFESFVPLYGGKILAATVLNQDPWTIPGAKSQTWPYTTLINSHDGSSALSVAPGSLVVVCGNTLRAHTASVKKDWSISVRHIGSLDVSDIRRQVSEMLSASAKHNDALREKLTNLAVNGRKVSHDSFLDALWPVDDEQKPFKNRKLRLGYSLINEAEETVENNNNPYQMLMAATEADQRFRQERGDRSHSVLRKMVKGGVDSGKALGIISELAFS